MRAGLILNQWTNNDIYYSFKIHYVCPMICIQISLLFHSVSFQCRKFSPNILVSFLFLSDIHFIYLVKKFSFFWINIFVCYKMSHLDPIEFHVLSTQFPMHFSHGRKRQNRKILHSKLNWTKQKVISIFFSLIQKSGDF